MKSSRLRLVADLHNHSCVSPCAALEMSPRAMAERARELGIDILGLTDHNTTANCPAFGYWCRELGIIPVFGMEITTIEELHVLALFATEQAASAFDAELFPLYRSIPNRPERWGDQVIVDKDDMIIGEIELHLTSGAMQIGLTELAGRIRIAGGMCIPAHIDRPTTSVTSQLGALPPGDFSALEIVRLPPPIGTRGLPLVCDSDAHYLADMGKRSFVAEMTRPDFSSLQEAVEAGRVQLSVVG
ncbi:PHP domain-containing protein [Spirochaeta africana]|uniref:Putative metal-dependent phosphoesterase, PHP family n=1 Tax=Spirochaeta africana (strain ATCC 700263 / DSM 8902 / Z-7692) TaxID=889378 RepID=H9ULN7_SPIAZ|nr:PHP domain-containing protein [Spirochaeta africana]AFG38430.1 putative metal-dependent phosphoesterase, PHP family [Spirochaeta africana DSM 8902]